MVTQRGQFDVDQYSAFDETGAARHMREHDVTRVWVAGLALDVCVKATVLDARQQRFEVNVILEGSRPVTAEGGQKAIAEMVAAGAVMIEKG